MAKSKNAKLSSNNLFNCLVYAVIGVMLVVLKGGSLGILMTVAGALLILSGLLEVLKGKDKLKGVLLVILGVAIIVCGWVIADMVLLIFGAFLILKGLIEVLKNYKKGLMANLSSIGFIIIGVLLVVAKWAFMDFMCTVAGVILIINAVLILIGKKNA